MAGEHFHEILEILGNAKRKNPKKSFLEILGILNIDTNLSIDDKAMLKLVRESQFHKKNHVSVTKLTD